MAVVRRVKNKLEEFKTTLPPDVRINIIMNTSEDILTSVKNLRTTLFYGIAFVVLVTLLFLRRLRTVFIIALTIPFSLIGAFIFLYLFGYTINLVSLMSLAIASGMVVDNGVVVLENIIRHREQDQLLVDKVRDGDLPDAVVEVGAWHKLTQPLLAVVGLLLVEGQVDELTVARAQRFER